MARNLFDLDNARDMHKQELVNTFIVTNAFERLLSPKNQIIIGSRGSGKTALLKMICHDHLSLYKNELAEKITQEKTFIGVFISTKTKFSGGLRNKDWQNENEKEKHFVWHMNLAACMSLLEALKSCLDTYVSDEQGRIEKEIKIISEIKKFWFTDRADIFTINDANQALEELAIFRQIENQKIRISDEKKINTIGNEFDIELFDPILAGINVINRVLNFPETTSWFICIDEVEMLEEFHHKILNSYLRAKQPNIFFKFTTLPYCHYTIETNLNVPLDIRHDVHYIYIDQDESFGYRGAVPLKSNALKLFLKRASVSKPEYTKISFHDIFGESKLLDNQVIDYSAFNVKAKSLSEKEVVTRMESNEILSLFLIHMNENYRRFGIELLKNKDISKFGNVLGRKTRAMLYLREYFQKTVGKRNIDIYSGARTIVTVGDCNPRKLIKIFNEMIIIAEKNNICIEDKRDDVPLISPKFQNLVLVTIAEQELNRYKIEKNFGTGLYEFINSTGEYMHDYIHSKSTKLNTEQLSSVEINNKNDDLHWEIIKRAVQKGLLYPNMNYNNPDDMPVKDGVFHLAFILSPRFRLLPRKGDSRNIAKILGETQLKLNFDA